MSSLAISEVFCAKLIDVSDRKAKVNIFLCTNQDFISFRFIFSRSLSRTHVQIVFMRRKLLSIDIRHAFNKSIRVEFINRFTRTDCVKRTAQHTNKNISLWIYMLSSRVFTLSLAYTRKHKQNVAYHYYRWFYIYFLTYSFEFKTFSIMH